MPKKDLGGGKGLTSVERPGKKEASAAKEPDLMEKVLKKESPLTKDSKERGVSEKEDARPDFNVELNSKVLCKYRDSLYYEAKITGIDESPVEGKIYTVHYQGWNSRHDEKIPQADIKARFLQCTEENLETARNEMQEARQSGKKRKARRLPGIGEEKKVGGTDSRSSTPSEKLPSGPASITSVERVGGRKSKGTPLRPVPLQNVIAEPPKTENKLELTSALMELLVDDYDMVTRQLHLSKIPARHTVQDIVERYVEYIRDTMPENKEETIVRGKHEIWMRGDVLIESAYGVQDMFDATLGARLLYKFEYKQYDEMMDRKREAYKKESFSTESGEESSSAVEDAAVEKKLKSSDTYGFIHLLRLLVKFGDLLRDANWEEQGERCVLTTLVYVERFVKFLDLNRQKFFDMQKDYIVAPTEYQKRYSDPQ